MNIPQAEDIINELIFITSRSSGPGGQNVNKVNSKVTLKFDVIGSVALSDEQKELISKKLINRLTKEGVLLLSAQENRSQLQNREEVLHKLDRLFTKIFTPKKIRKATKPSKAAKHARIKKKKEHSEKKQWRQKL